MSQIVNDLGVFPTPKHIVSQINNQVLQLFREQILSSSSNIPALILDNSVGDGRFLFDFAKKWLNADENSSFLPELHLYGVDINPESVDSCNAECKDFDNFSKIKFTFKQGNSLLGYINKPKGVSEFLFDDDINRRFLDDYNLDEIEETTTFFHWFNELDDMENAISFDICLGNPPFGIKFSPVLKKNFKKLYISVDPEVESYILFVERSVSLLRNRGILALLIPSNFATNLRYKQFRKYLLDNLELKKIIQLDFSAFSNASVETCVLIGIKKPLFEKLSYNKVEFYFYKKETGLTELGTCYQEEIRANEHLHIGSFVNSVDIDIINHIRRDNILLGDIVSIDRGIELGFRSSVTSDKKTTSKFSKLVAGRNIHPFTLQKPVRYIEFDMSNRRIYKDRAIYEKPKILLRRIGHKLIALYDPDNLFCVCDVYLLAIKTEYKRLSELYLVGLLNSSVLNFYLNQQFRSVKRIFPKIPIEYLKQLPIRIPKSDEKRIEIQNLALSLSTSYDQSQHDILNKKVSELYHLTKGEQERVESYIRSYL